ncbi:MipA/OmpV family protein [Rheinheimera sp. WS51]|uniref:MipA/OmpV family protein n=1 Tax=Rheinheimera sp. WS51 TaxID=3425886 RepID=UPI003D8F17D4
MRYFILLLLSIISLSPRAESACDHDNCADNSHYMFSLSLGYGQRSNPLYGGPELPLVLLPDFYYYGDNWFFDNGKLGATLPLTPEWQLSLVSQLNPEKGYFKKWFSSNYTTLGIGLPMPSYPNYTVAKQPEMEPVTIQQVSKRPTAFDAGLQADWFKQSWQAQAVIWQDISSSYHGQHASASLAKSWQHFSGTWQLTGRLYWKSAKLINTYYGISHEDTYQTQQYQAKASWQPEISLQWRHSLSERTTLVGLLRYLYLDTAMTQSPLIRSDHITTWFFGINYRLL